MLKALQEGAYWKRGVRGGDYLRGVYWSSGGLYEKGLLDRIWLARKWFIGLGY